MIIKKAFEEDNGQLSSMRIVWSICVLTVFGVWAYTCINTGALISFEVGDATLIGMLFGGKIGQKYLETKK